MPKPNFLAEFVDFHGYVMYWLGGTDSYVHASRPDLVSALDAGVNDETVTLSWQELAEIMATVRHNSRQR